MQITHIELGCRSPGAMLDFYSGVLGFAVQTRAQDSISVQVGWTKLTFRAYPFSQPHHIAFNIPQQQIETASWWAAHRVPLLKDSHGTDRFHFESWSAEAVYFHDPEGNIVELIARQGMRPEVFGAFDQRQVIGVSEVGIATDNVMGLAEELKHRCALAPYKEHSAEFCPVGTAAGLLILVETGRLWFPDFTTPAVHEPIALRFRDNEYKWFTLKFRDEEGIIVKVSEGFEWSS